MADKYRQRRDFLYERLKSCGFKVLESQGTYYLMVNIRYLGRGDDVVFCKSWPVLQEAARRLKQGFNR